MPSTHSKRVHLEADHGRGKAEAPKFKSPGVGTKHLSMREKMSRFYDNDRIVIASGLAILLFAPIAEHFLPISQDDLQPGFDSKEAGLESSPFAQKGSHKNPGLPPTTGEIIPLNSKDPSFWIVTDHDAVASLQPATKVSGKAPAAASGKKGDPWAEIVKDAASGGAKAAVDTAASPRVRAALATSLKGLATLAEGSQKSAAATSAAPANAAHLAPPARAAIKSTVDSGLVKVITPSGFRGLAKRTGIEPIAGGGFLRADPNSSAVGSSRSSSQQASQTYNATDSPGGGGGSMLDSGGGRPGVNPRMTDEKPKPESLAYLREKMEMQAGTKLKWDKKEWDELGRRKMLETAAEQGKWQLMGAAVQAAGTVVAGLFKSVMQNQQDRDSEERYRQRRAVQDVRGVEQPQDPQRRGATLNNPQAPRDEQEDLDRRTTETRDVERDATAQLNKARQSLDTAKDLIAKAEASSKENPIPPECASQQTAAVSAAKAGEEPCENAKKLTERCVTIWRSPPSALSEFFRNSYVSGQTDGIRRCSTIQDQTSTVCTSIGQQVQQASNISCTAR
ncbi:MAG: hypothetical protein HY059_22615 [Proteobacteria bacterium]|nr:hypothetical protein [Pseudomonadota bacterium]